MGEVRRCANPLCKVQFVTPPSAPHKRWCSEACSHEGRKYRRATPSPVEITCEICGGSFRPNRFHPSRQKCCQRPGCRQLRNHLLHNVWRQQFQSRRAIEVADTEAPPIDLHAGPDRRHGTTGDAPGAADGDRMPAQPSGEANSSRSALPPPPVAGVGREVRERFCANPACLQRFIPPPSAPGKQWCRNECRQADRNRRRRVTSLPDELRCEICGESFRPSQFHPTSQKCCWRAACRRLRNQLLYSNWHQRRRARQGREADVAAGGETAPGESDSSEMVGLPASEATSAKSAPPSFQQGTSERNLPSPFG